MKQRSNTKFVEIQDVRYKVQKTTVKRTRRTDAILRLRQQYVGSVDANPAAYNRDKVKGVGNVFKRIDSRPTPDPFEFS